MTSTIGLGKTQATHPKPNQAPPLRLPGEFELPENLRMRPGWVRAKAAICCHVSPPAGARVAERWHPASAKQ